MFVSTKASMHKLTWRLATVSLLLSVCCLMTTTTFTKAQLTYIRQPSHSAKMNYWSNIDHWQRLLREFKSPSSRLTIYGIYLTHGKARFAFVFSIDVWVEVLTANRNSLCLTRLSSDFSTAALWRDCSDLAPASICSLRSRYCRRDQTIFSKSLPWRRTYESNKHRWRMHILRLVACRFVEKDNFTSVQQNIHDNLKLNWKNHGTNSSPTTHQHHQQHTSITNNTPVSLTTNQHH